MTTTRDKGVSRLESQIRFTRTVAARAVREMHAAVLKDLQAAEERARAAERRAARVERRLMMARRRARRAERQLKRAHLRARHAERDLAMVQQSTTWKVGRVVIAGPAYLRRVIRQG